MTILMARSVAFSGSNAMSSALTELSPESKTANSSATESISGRTKLSTKSVSAGPSVFIKPSKAGRTVSVRNASASLTIGSNLEPKVSMASLKRICAAANLPLVLLATSSATPRYFSSAARRMSLSLAPFSTSMPSCINPRVLPAAPRPIASITVLRSLPVAAAMFAATAFALSRFS